MRKWVQTADGRWYPWWEPPYTATDWDEMEEWEWDLRLPAAFLPPNVVAFPGPARLKGRKS